MTIPFDLGPGAAAYLAVVMFVAAFVRGYSGFGFTAIVVTGSTLATDPMNFVPVVILIDVMLTLVQYRGLRGHIAWGRVTALAAGALVGVPLGVAVVGWMGIDLARLAISAFVLAMCGLFLSGWTIPSRQGRPAHAGVGLISGVANGAAVGGLPVAAYFAAQGVPAVTFRATVIIYFTVLDMWTLPFMAQAGMIVRDTFLAAIYGLPVLLLGLWLGGKHFLRADPQEFRRFAIWLLAALAVMGLLKSAV